MPQFVKINSPFPIVRNDTDSIRRQNKHDVQNLALLNESMCLVTFEATHGVPVAITNPFKDRGPPIGMRIIEAGGGFGGTLAVSGHTMDVARLTQDNRIDVTVFFEGRHTEPLLIKSLASSKLCANNTLTTIDTWNTDANAATRRTSVISESAGTWTVSEAGTYSVDFLCAFATGAYSLCEALIDPAGGVRLSSSFSAPFTNGAYVPISFKLELTAGDTFTLRAIQISGADRNVLSGTTNTRAAVSRLYNSTVDGYTTTVTAILYGPNANIIDVNG